VGFSWVVAWIVSTQPPWSIATSTITDPGCIVLRSPLRMSFGATAPGISTPPTTRSAVAICSSTLCRLEWMVCTFAGITSLR